MASFGNTTTQSEDFGQDFGEGVEVPVVTELVNSCFVGSRVVEGEARAFPERPRLFLARVEIYVRHQFTEFLCHQAFFVLVVALDNALLIGRQVLSLGHAVSLSENGSNYEYIVKAERREECARHHPFIPVMATERMKVFIVKKNSMISGRLKTVDAAISRCQGVPPCSDENDCRASESVNCELLLR